MLFLDNDIDAYINTSSNNEERSNVYEYMKKTVLALTLMLSLQTIYASGDGPGLFGWCGVALQCDLSKNDDGKGGIFDSDLNKLKEIINAQDAAYFCGDENYLYYGTNFKNQNYIFGDGDYYRIKRNKFNLWLKNKSTIVEVEKYALHIRGAVMVLNSFDTIKISGFKGNTIYAVDTDNKVHKGIITSYITSPQAMGTRFELIDDINGDGIKDFLIQYEDGRKQKFIYKED